MSTTLKFKRLSTESILENRAQLLKAAKQALNDSGFPAFIAYLRADEKFGAVAAWQIIVSETEPIAKLRNNTLSLNAAFPAVLSSRLQKGLVFQGSAKLRYANSEPEATAATALHVAKVQQAFPNLVKAVSAAWTELESARCETRAVSEFEFCRQALLNLRRERFFEALTAPFGLAAFHEFAALATPYFCDAFKVSRKELASAKNTFFELRLDDSLPENYVTDYMEAVDLALAEESSLGTLAIAVAFIDRWTAYLTLPASNRSADAVSTSTESLAAASFRIKKWLETGVPTSNASESKSSTSSPTADSVTSEPGHSGHHSEDQSSGDSQHTGDSDEFDNSASVNLQSSDNAEPDEEAMQEAQPGQDDANHEDSSTDSKRPTPNTTEKTQAGPPPAVQDRSLENQDASGSEGSYVDDSEAIVKEFKSKTRATQTLRSKSPQSAAFYQKCLATGLDYEREARVVTEKIRLYLKNVTNQNQRYTRSGNRLNLRQYLRDKTKPYELPLACIKPTKLNIDVIIDTSGSMGGFPIEGAKAVAMTWKRIADRLSEHVGLRLFTVGKTGQAQITELTTESSLIHVSANGGDEGFVAYRKILEDTSAVTYPHLAFVLTDGNFVNTADIQFLESVKETFPIHGIYVNNTELTEDFRRSMEKFTTYHVMRDLHGVGKILMNLIDKKIQKDISKMAPSRSR